MKILFIGDSLTNGKLGESFVKIIAQNNPNFKITNLGSDGETMNVIIERLLNHLRVETNYEYIIIQGGYNDLLLPTFKNKGTLFNFAYNHQLKKGLVPFDNPNSTSTFIKKAVSEIKQLYQGRIMFLTVGCVGENLSSVVNVQRSRFNLIVKKIISEENLILVDIGKEFETFLEDKKQSNFCLDSFWAVTIVDKMTNDFNKLSTKRKLFLTIDGVHLNKVGAEIFADCITTELKRLK